MTKKTAFWIFLIGTISSAVVFLAATYDTRNDKESPTDGWLVQANWERTRSDDAAPVSLPAEVRDWLQAYTDAHYRPEPKKRSRPASFRMPAERGG